MKHLAFSLLIWPLLFGCSTAKRIDSRSTASEASSVATAQTPEVRCGVRFGTGGDASLVTSFNDVLTLAVQGSDQTLLNQLDTLIPGGSQLGQRYCVKVQMEFASPKAIVDATEVQEICGYRYGRGRDASLVASMKGPQPLIDLNGRYSSKTLLQQLDSFIPGNTQVGTKYCVEARLDNRNTVIEILGAREY
ncbi:MAG: hypothetical protein K0R29_2744 [Pseudobdellovibrio sp.]|nr:hypothetical protein [Pseudobdellovibrio sp.]